MVPRERLVDIVLSRKFSPFDRSIDMHVSKIRKKLGDSDSGVDHIKTVRGVGYIFTRPQDPVTEKTAQDPTAQSASLGENQERRVMRSRCSSRFFSPTGWRRRFFWCWPY